MTMGCEPRPRAFAGLLVAGLGGSAQADALATEQFWTRMITFLHHLAIHQAPHSRHVARALTAQLAAQCRTVAVTMPGAGCG